MYIKVQNIGEIPIHGIRLLGLSRKEDAAIGQFGTGLKEAIALALRLDTSVAIFSGELRIDFENQEHDGENEICFSVSESLGRYEAGTWYGLGIHPDFGRHDWTKPFQVLREVFCNAEDESGLVFDLVTEPKGEAGKTTVFLEASMKMMSEYGLVEDKLLFLSEPKVLGESKFGRIIEKRLGSGAQIFHKGVWIQASPKSSRFDFEIKNLRLTEARSADWNTVIAECAQLIGAASVAVLKIFLADLDDEETFETCTHGWEMRGAAGNNCDNWKEAWYSLHGDKAVACQANALNFSMDHIVNRGYVPIFVPFSILQLLKNVGVRTERDVLTEDILEGREVFAYESVVAQEVFDILKIRGIMTKEMPSVQAFRQVGSTGGKELLGRCANNKIYINESVIGSQMERIVALEELLHYESGACDLSTDFQNHLLATIEAVIFPRRTP